MKGRDITYWAKVVFSVEIKEKYSGISTLPLPRDQS